MQSDIESWTARRVRLLRANPDYITVTDVARMLNLTKAGVLAHTRSIKHIVIEGMTLYHRHSAEAYASTFVKRESTTRIGFRGADVERIREICEGYYRSYYDSGSPDVLKLAKKVAGL